MRPVDRTVRSLSILLALLLASAVGTTPPADAQVPSPGPADLEALAGMAFAGGPGAEAAAAELRRAGEAGADILPPLLAAWERCTAGGCADPAAAEVTLDHICGVRDCAELRLFWHTDLDAAVATARREGKAVLSLRLLGRLDEELSCANSRFFRTVFYRDPSIAEVLRERYVLHWESVAPVPKVTIELADGRRVERAVVGNSLHYVLDGRGRPILALPGLMGPKSFRRALETVAPFAAETSTALDDEAQLRWAHEAWRLRRERRRTLLANAQRSVENGGTGAYLLTGSKAPTIAPMARALGADPATVEYQTPDDAALQALAEARRGVVEISRESREFMLAKQGVTEPERANRMVASFEASIALDEVIDLYRIEPAILEHLLAADQPIDLGALTDWIYREVFRTPLDDPFLGLAPDDVYAALPAPTRTAAQP